MFTLNARPTKVTLSEINNNGPLINDDLVEKIFNLHVTKKATGSGLGLPFLKVSYNQHG